MAYTATQGATSREPEYSSYDTAFDWWRELLNMG